MNQKESKYTTFQRVLAMIGVIVLVLLSILALVFSVIPFPALNKLSWAFLIAAIFVPILIWIFIWIYGQMHQKRTIASFRTEEQEKIRQEAEEIKSSQRPASSVSDDTDHDANQS